MNVQKYLNDWCKISKKFNIAIAFFEIGSLLALDGNWQKLEHIKDKPNKIYILKPDLGIEDNQKSQINL